MFGIHPVLWYYYISIVSPYIRPMMWHLVIATTRLWLQDRSNILPCPFHLCCTNTPDPADYKTEAISFPVHSKPIKEREEELISGRFIIPGNKFVKSTNKFKYPGSFTLPKTHQMTPISIKGSASKNSNALGKELFRNCKISLLVILNLIFLCMVHCNSYHLSDQVAVEHF